VQRSAVDSAREKLRPFVAAAFGAIASAAHPAAAFSRL
jgi:hypothetical protein